MRKVFQMSCALVVGVNCMVAGVLWATEDPKWLVPGWGLVGAGVMAVGLAWVFRGDDRDGEGRGW